MTSKRQDKGWKGVGFRQKSALSCGVDVVALSNNVKKKETKYL